MKEQTVSRDDSILVIALLSGLVALWLSYTEMRYGDCCPAFPFTAIPACYLVFLFYFLVVVSRKVGNPNLKYGLGLGASVAGLVTAVWFSLNHLMGIVECPTLLGIPLCFASFIVFFLLLILISPRR